MNRVREKWMAHPLKLRMIASVGFLVAKAGIAFSVVGFAQFIEGRPGVTGSVGLVIAGVGFGLVGVAYILALTGSGPRTMALPAVLFGAGQISSGLSNSCHSWIAMHELESARAAAIRTMGLAFGGAAVIFFLLAMILLLIAITTLATPPKPSQGRL